MAQEFEIAVVGSGIAGLSAGLAAARLGRSTLVLTGETLGGHLLSIERIDGYPGFAEGVAGYDLCPTVQEQATAAGAEFSMASVTSLGRDGEAWLIETPAGSYSARAVILASGTRFRELGVTGESLLRGKGVSQCASCDAPLLRDKEVIVAGGGDSALQEALTLAEHCSRVTIVHHGSELGGQAAYRALAESSDRIVLRPDSEIVEILGEQAVTGARVERVGTGETEELQCASVFTFIGLQPNTAFIEDNERLTASGHVRTDGAMRTDRPGLLAAGTVRAGSTARAATASGEGMAAALAADAYLASGGWIE